MFLSDRSIKEELKSGGIKIEPLGKGCIQPASVDLHLDNKVWVLRRHSISLVDIRKDYTKFGCDIAITDKEPFILHPQAFILASTLERIAIADHLVARLEGKSSLGRLGIVVHATAGFVDPGWDGHLTLEIANLSEVPVTLYAGMKISQVSFGKLTTPAEHPYGSSVLKSKYKAKSSRGPQPSLYHKNFNSNSPA